MESGAVGKVFEGGGVRAMKHGRRQTQATSGTKRWMRSVLQCDMIIRLRANVQLSQRLRRSKGTCLCAWTHPRNPTLQTVRSWLAGISLVRFHVPLRNSSRANTRPIACSCMEIDAKCRPSKPLPEAIGILPWTLRT